MGKRGNRPLTTLRIVVAPKHKACVWLRMIAWVRTYNIMYIVYRVICKKCSDNAWPCIKCRCSHHGPLHMDPGRFITNFFGDRPVHMYILLGYTRPWRVVHPDTSRQLLVQAGSIKYGYLYIYNTWRGLKNAERENVYSIIMHPYFCFTGEADRREKDSRKSFFFCAPPARARILYSKYV